METQKPFEQPQKTQPPIKGTNDLWNQVQYYCKQKEFVGGVGDGGWPLCMERITNLSIVYAFGIGGSVAFEMALIKNKSCHVWSFDPTPMGVATAKSQQYPPPQWHFVELGISYKDGVMSMWQLYDGQFTNKPTNEPVLSKVNFLVLTVRSFAEYLNHNNVDVIKIDIEGGEFDVLTEMFNNPPFLPDQLLLEFHFFSLGSDGSSPEINKWIQFLNTLGYRIFHVNPLRMNGKTTLREYAFVRSE